MAGYADDPAYLVWDDDRLTVYIATDLGLFVAKPVNAPYGQRNLETRLVLWPEVDGPSLVITTWFGRGDTQPSITFALADPEIHATELTGSDRTALLDFAKVCLRRAGRPPA